MKGVATHERRPNIVLVHGAWADGSSWSGVIERLQADGFQVRAPQFPLSSLADDVARLRQVLEFQDGPTIVAGHSYGGQIITALGTDAPNVVGLVYIAAFALDEGESLGALLSQGPVTPALAHLFTDSRGYGWLSEDDFVNHFAGDVEPTRARVLYAVQQSLASSAFTDAGHPAWKSAARLTSSPRTTKRSHPMPSGSSPHGWRDHRRGTVEPRGDGLPRGGRSRPRREGSRSRRCRRSMTVEAVAHVCRRSGATGRGRQRDRVRLPRPGGERRTARPPAALPRQSRQLGPGTHRCPRRGPARDHLRQRRRRGHHRPDAEHHRGDGPRCHRLPRGD